ncbi:MAG: type I polyketide synthase, partial [Acidobacteriota bacterium]|nr:type I polyketide synthase [Acidobacteriota bacterium]
MNHADRAARRPAASSDIAVIGMAGRFSGAADTDQFWRNLVAGVESINFFSERELIESGLDPRIVRAPNYVPAYGVLGDIEGFDPAFFGYAPREAEIIDPQQRIFLECAWEALEKTGYDSTRYRGLVGVWAGVTMSSYLLNLYPLRDRLMAIGIDPTMMAVGNDKDSLATRVSYKLDLRGPSMTVQTACSTSLVAVHMACQSLLSEETDIALAGAVSAAVPQKAGYFYQEEGIFSPDGHCRAFDAKAAGTVFGSGAGIVVLKLLDGALADGDHVHAIIKGSAVNNDGSTKVGYTAPSLDGQAEVIIEALANAGVEPDSVGYIEAHGTATALGDPIEIQALTKAFRRRTERQGFCALGSVKTNLGHLEVAAGIAGLIKTVLAIEHAAIPATLHFERPNPRIDFAASPFYVNTRLSEWPAGRRRAGVSSFGFGGTNAHVVLEEAPAAAAVPPEARPWQLLVLSARSGGALEKATDNLAEFLAVHPETPLANAAFTLQVGRRVFEHRRTAVCRDREEAIAALRGRDRERVLSAVHDGKERPVVFLFPGQGTQHVDMARELYQSEEVFRAELDRTAERFRAHLGIDLRTILYPAEDAEEEAIRELSQTAVSQPALFAVELALARLWESWGVRPRWMIGRSLG